METRAHELARIIYEEMCRPGEPDGEGGVPLPFSVARKYKLNSYVRARKAADRILGVKEKK